MRLVATALLVSSGRLRLGLGTDERQEVGGRREGRKAGGREGRGSVR